MRDIYYLLALCGDYQRRLCSEPIVPGAPDPASRATGSWARRELSGADLGDPRRGERLVSVVEDACLLYPGRGIDFAVARRAEAAGRLEGYLERLGAAIGHADRREPLRAYVTGLLLPGSRKSVEPMAARIDPRHVRARHQSMHHLVASAPWDEREVLRSARDYALEPLGRHAPIGAWVIDDTGMPKKGRMSVGVARPYCGQLGKQDNCQVAVTISLVNAVMSVPAAYRLYLPEAWAKDRRHCSEAGIPQEVKFQKK